MCDIRLTANTTHPRRAGRLLASALPAALLLLASPAFAGNGQPVFTVSGNTAYSGNGMLNSASVFLPGGVLTVQYPILKNFTVQQIADNLTDALNNGINPVGNIGGSQLPNFFRFTEAAPVVANGVTSIVIQGAPAPANPNSKSFGASRTTGLGIAVTRAAAGQPRNFIRVGVAIDPLPGFAQFEITGTPSGTGSVTLGIEGMTLTANESPTENTDSEIMADFESQLLTMGFSSGQEFNNLTSPVDDEFSLFGIETGTANGIDQGAFVETDDPNLSTYAAVFVPEPASLTLLGLAAPALLLRRRAR
jgi:hypothetical protein